jgi:thioredoxin-like negative regulator of GroEL
MSDPSRREKMEAMLADDPQDQFLRYALALELEKDGEHERSLEFLKGLMGESPPHVPSFLMAAQALIQRSKVDDARSILRQGIEAARQQGEDHAASEMSELLTTLGALGE